VRRRFPDGPPQLDPVTDLKITGEDFLTTVRKIEALEDRLTSHPMHKREDLKEQFEAYEHKLSLERTALQLRIDIKNASQDVAMHQQLKCMKRVLRRLGHTTADNVIDLKGRVACEISTCDELIGTELMFSGLFNDLAPETLVALCSCLVFDEKNDEPMKLKEELAAPFRQLQDAAKRVAQVMQDAKLPIDTEYLKRFQPQMMELVYAWCKGAKFSDICKMTDIFEGSIIRVMRRLEELLRQFANASKSIGNTDLALKFEAGIEKLKRDIVFAASLYL